MDSKITIAFFVLAIVNLSSGSNLGHHYNNCKTVDVKTDSSPVTAPSGFPVPVYGVYCTDNKIKVLFCRTLADGLGTSITDASITKRHRISTFFCLYFTAYFNCNLRYNKDKIQIKNQNKMPKTYSAWKTALDSGVTVL